ncbi:metallophosphoesterase family protein [Phreatobacter stygius]|nr:metallophosphoesterase [Phreatobacter stygius]
MFRLAHLSDLHIGPLPEPGWRELAGKRLTGYLNWRRGRAEHHRMAVLDRVLADIAGVRPDHVAVTGDLINLGLAGEYGPALSLLERIGPPDRVSVVPGNHDAYIRATLPAIVGHWAPWFAGDHEPPPPGLDEAFPFVRRRGRVALIGVNSGVPKPPFLATGTLGQRQLAALGETLDALRQEGLARVLLIHHPPFPIGWHKQLTDHTGLAAILSRSGAELVLHGHTHVGSVRQFDGAGGPIPVHGVASASAADDGTSEPAGWNLVSIDGAPGAWQVMVETRRPAA